MGLLDIFSPKKIGEIATSAVRGLDDVVYTDQERAERTVEAQRLYSTMWLAAVPSALSRRIIAAITIGVWAVMLLSAVATHAWLPETSAFIVDLIQKEIVLYPVNAIVGFYFLKQVVTEYRKGASS